MSANPYQRQSSSSNIYQHPLGAFQNNVQTTQQDNSGGVGAVPTMINPSGGFNLPTPSGNTYVAPTAGHAVGSSVTMPPPSAIPQHLQSQGGGYGSVPGSPAVGRSPGMQRIRPAEIPTPTAADQNKVTTYPTLTNRSTLPPPATSEYRVIDEGNCSPRFMRMTMYTIPCASDLQSSAHIPLGIIVQPLAELGAGEEEVPVVDFGPSGPVRCNRCRSYINAFAQFTHGGRSYICKICDATNDVPQQYYCPLDMTGRRQDLVNRPELLKGSVDFVVSTSTEFSSRPIQPPCYLFAIDVSYTAVSTGMLHTCLHSIKTILDSLPDTTSTRVGFVTFDSTVHFYSIRSNQSKPQMAILADIDDPFLPIAPEAIFARYQDSKAAVNSLLETLPNLYNQTKIGESAFGSAVKAASLALKGTGGKLLMFQTALPSIGVGKLKRRDEPKVMGTDKEKSLYNAADPYYTSLAMECVQAHTNVDLFLFPTGFIDVATLSELTKNTGGQLYYYPQFDWRRDGIKFQAELTRNVTRYTGFEAVMKVRSSRGLSVTNYFGNFHMGAADELELAGIDCDKSFCVQLKHDEKMTDKTIPCIQCALLYTTPDGQRRIRVHTLTLGCSSVMGTIFKGVDCDAVLNYFARSAMSQIQKTEVKKVSDSITDNCIDTLYTYRKLCAASSSTGQLILPETLKYLPIFVLSLIKNNVLRPGREVQPDERSFLMNLLNCIPVALSTPFLYPRMFALHDIPQDCGYPDENGHVKLPPLVKLTSESLNQQGAYLLENGQRMFLWLGSQLHPQWIEQAFGYAVPVDQLNLAELELPSLENEVNVKICWIIDALRKARPGYPSLTITKQGDRSEVIFRSLLVEDKASDLMSYVDYLCHIHKQIQIKLMG
eukprot:TRINITY_DN4026_c0_g1_i1.p1 TRINITY_DN4026_c0_g1~~TRINITY_DN4026_c0_g1_i1.p1  ORF type:complete len:883 (-),score=243.77 TRINITY_DN4026_c0_g1_i1:77-2725(-)